MNESPGVQCQLLGSLSSVCVRTGPSFMHRVRTGQENLEKVRECVWSGKGQGKYFFDKSGKINDLGLCRVQISVIFCVPKY